MYLKIIYLQKKKRPYLLGQRFIIVWFDWNDYIQNIPFKILMFLFSAWCEFEWTFFSITALFTVAIHSFDIYDMKSVPYFM